MNLPNKLTILRVILVPFLVFFMLTDVGGAANKWICLIVFIVACLTDTLDGRIARKYNLITNFGKFMDPLADKLLVCCAMLCLAGTKIPMWVIIIIIGREFIISGIRLVASDSGVVIAASIWGKYKTTFQMLMVISMIMDLGGIFDTISLILMAIATALTVISLIDYVYKNRDVVLKVSPHDEKKLEEKLVGLLSEKGLTATSAESCTGGMIASAIVNVPGASDVFKEGYVTYSNEAKERLLGVRHETLERFGAVSRETALEMAYGAAKASGADVAISSTGIAGPDGGTKEKPVGLVYTGIYVRGTAEAFMHRFSGDRLKVRTSTVEKALEAAIEKIGKVSLKS